MCKFISGFFMLFHWSVCLFLCQYHAVWVAIVLLYNLKLGNVILPVLLFAQAGFGYSESFLVPHKP